MINLNPMQLLGMLKSGNPQQIATQIIQQNFPNDPMMQNLLKMAQNGNEQGIQQFATQFFNSQGKDFNSEMNNLMSAIKKV